ncbi:MAG: carbohydrate-binding protein [Sumerlaeia bacterium]
MDRNSILFALRAALFALAALAFLPGSLAAQGARFTPNVPTGGESVLIEYDTRDSVFGYPDYPQVNLFYTLDGWATATDVPMEFQSGFWQYLIVLPVGATSLDFAFHDGEGAWVNNGGVDWHVDVLPVHSTGGVVSLSPALPEPGDALTVTYDASLRPLDGLADVTMHWSVNGWSGIIADAPMTQAQPNIWTATVQLPADAASVDMAFFSGSAWDNNEQADWHFETASAANGLHTVILSPGETGTLRAWSALGQSSVTYEPGEMRWGRTDIYNFENAMAVFPTAILPSDVEIVAVELQYAGAEALGMVVPTPNPSRIVNAPGYHPALPPSLNYYAVSTGPVIAETAFTTFPIFDGGAHTLSLGEAGRAAIQANLGSEWHSLGFAKNDVLGRFILQDAALRVTLRAKPDAAANYNSVSVAGTFNGWNPSAQNMTLVGDHEWLAVLNVSAPDGVAFKFTANGTWNDNWGDDSPSRTTSPTLGIGSWFGANIVIETPIAGQLAISFNDQTRAYAVVSF